MDDDFRNEEPSRGVPAPSVEAACIDCSDPAALAATTATGVIRAIVADLCSVAGGECCLGGQLALSPAGGEFCPGHPPPGSTTTDAAALEDVDGCGGAATKAGLAGLAGVGTDLVGGPPACPRLTLPEPERLVTTLGAGAGAACVTP
mmetsp:Transcript_43944/g.103972  ORF Transcript_43944/g.103972 Transcript_43944/m.103972 type:complete len:147 (+) Transcript_43944:470-910(+)